MAYDSKEIVQAFWCAYGLGNLYTHGKNAAGQDKRGEYADRKAARLLRTAQDTILR